MRYLTKKEIIFVNERTVKIHGGQYLKPFNFLNEGPLDYLVDIVSADLFGAPIYPKISDKAGVYMFNLITNHIFQDGNKRTGLEIAILFLDMNGYRIDKKLPKDSIYDFTIKVASGLSTLEECQSWFETHMVTEYL